MAYANASGNNSKNGGVDLKTKLRLQVIGIMVIAGLLSLALAFLICSNWGALTAPKKTSPDTAPATSTALKSSDTATNDLTGFSDGNTIFIYKNEGGSFENFPVPVKYRSTPIDGGNYLNTLLIYCRDFLNTYTIDKIGSSGLQFIVFNGYILQNNISSLPLTTLLGNPSMYGLALYGEKHSITMPEPLPTYYKEEHFKTKQGASVFIPYLYSKVPLSDTGKSSYDFIFDFKHIPNFETLYKTDPGDIKLTNRELKEGYWEGTKYRLSCILDNSQEFYINNGLFFDIELTEVDFIEPEPEPEPEPDPDPVLTISSTFNGTVINLPFILISSPLKWTYAFTGELLGYMKEKGYNTAEKACYTFEKLLSIPDNYACDTALTTNIEFNAETFSLEYIGADNAGATVMLSFKRVITPADFPKLVVSNNLNSNILTLDFKEELVAEPGNLRKRLVYDFPYSFSEVSREYNTPELGFYLFSYMLDVPPGYAPLTADSQNVNVIMPDILNSANLLVRIEFTGSSFDEPATIALRYEKVNCMLLKNGDNTEQIILEPMNDGKDLYCKIDSKDYVQLFLPYKKGNVLAFEGDFSAFGQMPHLNFLVIDYMTYEFRFTAVADKNVYSVNVTGLQTKPVEGSPIDKIGDFFKGIGGWFSGVGSSLWDFVSGGIGAAGNLFKGAIDFMGNIFKGASGCINVLPVILILIVVLILAVFIFNLFRR